jgi:DNA (cytosine-5)-methyltransferase 1
MKPFRVIDLFAGAGGSSTAAKIAADVREIELELTAVNHWDTAIHTHTLNHPWAAHILASVQGVRWGKRIPGDIDLLIAGPECTNHSPAKGDQPLDDASRASAWSVVEVAEAKRPKYILVENVPRFAKYGPLGLNRRPLKSRESELFELWCQAFRVMGYTLEYRVLNSADFGGAQTRQRLFILMRLDGVRRRGPLPWPMPTHAEAAKATMGRLLPWRPAREIIDPSLTGESIFHRDRPLSPNTLQRIAIGARKYWGIDLEPFIVVMRRNADARSVDLPLPTVTTSGNHFYLVEPLVLGQHGGSVARPVSMPLPTIATDGALSLVEPFIIAYYGTMNVRSATDPLATVPTRDRFALITSMIESGRLDITHRMFAEHELAAAQGFPADYKFVGNSGDVKAQIGNAWEINNGMALFGAILDEHYGEVRRAA